jgi:hypothetical protein
LLQKFHESLIDLLLLLRGCIIGGVSSHAGIGGEFYHFWIFLKNYHYFAKGSF